MADFFKGQCPSKMTYYKAQGDIQAAAKAALSVVEDPYLPEVAGLVIQLHRIESEKSGDADAPSVPTKGIGLKYAVTPLKIFVKYRQNPWMTYAIVGSVLGLSFLAGYAAGRAKRKKK